MSKDIRLVVRLSEELLAWYNAEAVKIEMPTAAYVRMVLAERKNAAVSRQFPQSVTIIPETFSPNGDDLKGFSTVSAVGEDRAFVPADIDLDALVAAQVQTAEANGATAPMDNGYGGFVEPDPGVRVLQQHRRKMGKEWGSRI